MFTITKPLKWLMHELLLKIIELDVCVYTYMYIYRATLSWGHFAVLILDWGKDLIFQYQKSKIPWGWDFTYSNIFGFSILACRSSFIRFFYCFSCIGLTLSKEQLLKWNICRCWFYWLELPTVRKPIESKWSIIRIRAQYSLALEIVLLNCGVLSLSSKIYF